MNDKKELKTYIKPSLKDIGDLKSITKAGQDGEGDYAGRFGYS